MRSENDKKNFKTSVKMTQSDHELLEQRARECGKKIGPYIVEAAVKADKSITPETVAKLQNIVNSACEAVKETSPKKAKDMQKEVDDLWSLRLLQL